MPRAAPSREEAPSEISFVALMVVLTWQSGMDRLSREHPTEQLANLIVSAGIIHNVMDLT